MALTVKLMHRGQYADAIDAYSLAIDLHPDASWAYAGLGEAYLMTDMKAPAVDNFRKALAADTITPSRTSISGTSISVGEKGP